MAAPELRNKLAQFWDQVARISHKPDEWTHGWLGMITGAARLALRFDSAIMAAAIAYFALFSLFPLIVLSISIASLDIGFLIEQQFIIQRMEFIAPALSQLLGKNIDEIIRSRGPVTGVALISLIWSASNIFNMLTQTLNVIWAHKRRRSIWKQRGLAILLVLAFAGPALLLGSLASSIFGNLRTWLPDQITPIWGVASFIVALFLDISLFMLLYNIFPHGSSTWRDLLPGGIAAGLLWELAKKAFLFFVSTYVSASNLIYGSVTAIIAFLTWAHLSSLIFLFGAFLNVAYYQQKQEGNEKST